MPDFRYRQTTATVDARGPVFRATGRQPIELSWRAAFPDWQPAEERGEDAQLLPALHDGEAACLSDATVEAKETRPPPRYNEGTLIDAMQNAWRFVADEAQRERLKGAKGIGTPATRGETIRGLKTQEFLVADGKHIVPTERGLVLHGVLERADPALVDPGVTAQMERLLDDVLEGRRDMMSAIDAVCEQASRIIGRLTERGAADKIPTIPTAAAAPTRSQQQSLSRTSGPVRSKATTSRRQRKPALGAETGSPPTTGAAVKQRRPKALSISSDAGTSAPERIQAKPGREPRVRSRPASPVGGQIKRPVTNKAGDVSSGGDPAAYSLRQQGNGLVARGSLPSWRVVRSGRCLAHRVSGTGLAVAIARRRATSFAGSGGPSELFDPGASHSRNLDQRRRPLPFLTAMARARRCPVI